MKKLLNTIFHFAFILVVVICILGCSNRNKSTTDRVIDECLSYDSIKPINSNLDEIYLGININDDLNKVLAHLDSLSKDCTVSEIQLYDYKDREIDYIQESVGLKEIDKSVSFDSEISLRKGNQYETVDTRCEILFYRNKLYAIEIHALADSVQVANLYTEKYGRPNIPSIESEKSTYIDDIWLHDYSKDDYSFSFIDERYYTLTGWKFMNAAIKLIVIYENKHEIYFNGRRLKDKLYEMSCDYYNFTKDEMMVILKDCSITKESDSKVNVMHLFYINEEITKKIEKKIAHERDSISRADEQLELRRKREARQRSINAKAKMKSQKI